MAALGEALRRRRGALNALVARARTVGEVSDAELRSHLSDTIEPLVEAVARAAPGRAEETAFALVKVSLELLARGLLGPDGRSPAIAAGWRELLPAIPRLLAADPERLAGALSNALDRIAATPGADYETWIRAMAELGARAVEPAQYLKAGQVLAWRAGLAHYREGALAAARELPAELALAALGAPGTADLPGLLERLERDPWLDPSDPDAGARRPRLARRAGGFRGFGGPFIDPPRVFLIDGELGVRDSEAAWIVRADCFGATFHRQEVAAEDRVPPGARIDKAGKVTDPVGGARGFPELAGATSFASRGPTLAVTLASSHCVFLVALA